MIKVFSRPAIIALTLFLVSLVFYGNAALNFPVLFNLDNYDNFAATRYIAKHHKIPMVEASDKEILFTRIGTTRSLRPPFTFIVSATLANLAEPVLDDRIARQRLGSPLLGALTIVVVFLGFYIAFKRNGLAFLGATIVGLMPKFVFLASCNNDDIGALLSISMLFSSVLALIRYKAKAWVLIALALSLGLVLQTKYTAWLPLPWFGIFCLFLLRPVWPRVIKMMPLLIAVCVAAGGWWIVFNMVNYGWNDPTALRYASALQSNLSDITPNQQGYYSNGIGLTELLANHDQFLSKSYKSLLGYLEWIELEMSAQVYFFYGAFFSIGIASVFLRGRNSSREVAYFDVLIVLILLSQLAFYVHHNLVRDIQPQARYILPLIMPMVYLFIRALTKVHDLWLTLKIGNKIVGFHSLSVVGIFTLLVILYTNNYINYVQPSFSVKPYYTSIVDTKNINLEEGLKIVSSASVTYKYIDNKLELQRTDTKLPTLLLDPGFCELLPLNALISLTVSSPFKGGLYLRLDHDDQGTYDDLYWRSFPAGKSTAIFSVNAQNCSGVKITLASNTVQLTLDDLQISELRIHQHGKPI